MEGIVNSRERASFCTLMVLKDSLGSLTTIKKGKWEIVVKGPCKKKDTGL